MRLGRVLGTFVGLASLPATAAVAADKLPVLPAGVVEAKAPATLIPDLKWGDEQNWVEFYGQIDKGVLFFNDGEETSTFIPVDNADSSTRFGFRALATLSDDMTLGGNFEWEWNPYSTNNVNQLNINDFDWDTNLLRKLEIYFTSEDMGKLWLGQGSMASDNSAEVDLSGTSVVGYAAVQDMSGGPFFRFTDGTLSDVKVKDAFNDFDGLSRKLRIRYDTPSFEGFTLAASVGTQVVPTVTDVAVWDIAARYENEIGDFEVASAVAFSMPDDDQTLVDGSFSVLHVPTGISLTMAGAIEQGPSAAEGRYIYGKLGYQTDYFDWGATAVSVDAFFGQDIDAPGSSSRAIGAQLVQNIDYLQTELYLGARLYDYDEQVAAFDDGFAVLTGARLRF